MYITTTHEALGTLLANVTVTTDLQRTVVGLSLRVNPLKLYSSQASCVVSGFLLVKLRALAHHLHGSVCL